MRPIWPVLAAAATGFQVGAAIVATRFVVDQTSPASLALLRYIIGFCCLLPPALLGGGFRFAARDLVPIALLGITQFGIVVALLNYALQFIPSGRAALIFASFPLLTMLIAAALGRERMTVPKSAGILLTFAGVALALAERAMQPAGNNGGWTGELAAFASALAGAICSVLYRPYLRKYEAVPVAAFAMLASVAFLAALAAGEGFFTAVPHFTPGGWAAVLFIGISSGVGYFLWLWALANTTPTKVAVFLSLSPITAAALGAVLLAEPISAATLAGIGCVAAGLWLAPVAALFRHSRERGNPVILLGNRGEEAQHAQHRFRTVVSRRGRRPRDRRAGLPAAELRGAAAARGRNGPRSERHGYRPQ